MIEKSISLKELLASTSRRGFLGGLGAAAVGLSIPALQGCTKAKPKTEAVGGEEPTLNFYNWDTYIGDSTLADFKNSNGIEVRMSLFANNDELFAKQRAGNSGYDVIVPSNEYVERMAQAKLIQPLDLSKIPNLKNIGAEFRDVAYDPGRKYSMPYTWLILGIGYRKSKVKGVPDSWKWLLDSDAYKGRISLLSESQDLFRLTYKYLGKSINGYTPELLAEAEKLLTRQKPFVKVFHDDNGQDLLLSGEVDLVLEYNGDIAQVMTEDSDLAFVVPKEGSLLTSDCLCIPIDAPHPNNAHAFINNLLDAQVGAKIYEQIKYPAPNEAARALLGDDYKNNPVIFPSQEDLARSEYGQFQSQESASAMETAMTRVRAS